jgi:hypothetical protein
MSYEKYVRQMSDKYVRCHMKKPLHKGYSEAAIRYHEEIGLDDDNN